MAAAYFNNLESNFLY